LALNEYLSEIHPGWFCFGTKQQVPKCACYVARHKECGCTYYVWVPPESRRNFEEFTLKVLRITALINDPGAGQAVGGVIYSPPVSR
jgi:hypothetical protein